MSSQITDFSANLKSSSACGYVTKKQYIKSDDLRYLTCSIPHRVNFKNIILKIFTQKNFPMYFHFCLFLSKREP